MPTSANRTRILYSEQGYHQPNKNLTNQNKNILLGTRIPPIRTKMLRTRNQSTRTRKLHLEQESNNQNRLLRSTIRTMILPTWTRILQSEQGSHQTERVLQNKNFANQNKNIVLRTEYYSGTRIPPTKTRVMFYAQVLFKSDQEYYGTLKTRIPLTRPRICYSEHGLHQPTRVLF